MIAMEFTTEVNWNIMDFIVAGFLLLGTGLACNFVIQKVKNPKTGRTRTVSYGQAGKAKKGGDRIRPGTAKGNAYCARSAKIKKCKNPPCANALSRKKWKCQGSRSVK